MKHISSWMAKTWGVIVWLFEKADIIPPLIIVSTWHYAGALSGKDPAPVAVVLGVLIDLGHYRAVKAFLRDTSDKARFAVMTVFTCMTGYYHYLWYRDYLLAAGVPILIIGLALLSKWERWERQAGNMTVTVENPERRELAQNDTPKLPVGNRRQYSEYMTEQTGKPLMPVAVIMAAYGVPQRTAYRWREKYKGQADE